MEVLAVAVGRDELAEAIVEKGKFFEWRKENFKKRSVIERKNSRNEVKLKEMLSWRNPRLNEIVENLELQLWYHIKEWMKNDLNWIN